MEDRKYIEHIKQYVKQNITEENIRIPFLQKCGEYFDTVYFWKENNKFYVKDFMITKWDLDSYLESPFYYGGKYYRLPTDKELKAMEI